jgi:hypothetical protein
MVAVDNQARLRNQERLRSLIASHGAEVTVFSAHDAVEFESIRSGAPLRTGVAA